MPDVTRGTRNVFADLGYPDAELRQARLRLSIALNQLLAPHVRGDSDAVQRLGISPTELSDLRSYRLRAFPVMRMLSIFVALGYDVDVVVRPKGSGRVKVQCERGRSRTRARAS